jgi:hypothetical protein
MVFFARVIEIHKQPKMNEKEKHTIFFFLSLSLSLCLNDRLVSDHHDQSVSGGGDRAAILSCIRFNERTLDHLLLSSQSAAPVGNFRRAHPDFQSRPTSNRLSRANLRMTVGRARKIFWSACRVIYCLLKMNKI